MDEDLHHPVTDAVQSLGRGWHRLSPAPSGANLDYVRANLFDPLRMRPLPPDVSGPDNDLADLLDHYVQRAMADDTACCRYLVSGGVRRRAHLTRCSDSRQAKASTTST